MSRVFLYAHGGGGNQGCEAIVRSTAEILGIHDATLISSKPDEDTYYGLNEICEIIREKNNKLHKWSLSFIKAYLSLKCSGNYIPMDSLWYEDAFSKVNKGDIAFSIGGDNYCYADVEKCVMFHDMLKKRGAKTVLWGCSVEPDIAARPEIAVDLAKYNLITARESISYEALKQINSHTVLIPDPAFVLKRIDMPLPEGWKEGNTIGINASPLILKTAADGNVVMEAYESLIRRILDTTDCAVALIPHVVWENNDDRIPLKALYDAFSETGRVLLLDDHNCMELKGYIARCRMFIGARTHATIAAYSSCVPTLVLGYSVKSRGIARDLFGTEENYVLPVQQLQDSNGLADGFAWLMGQEEEIRKHLADIIPDHQKKARSAVCMFAAV